MSETGLLAENLAIGSAMVIAAILVHFFGLVILLAVMGKAVGRFSQLGAIMQSGALLLLVVFGLVAVHTIEIWMFALLYLGIGEFSTLEDAIYFSATTFSTLGYGDVTMSREHRLIGAIEGVLGFLLIGWSTAFLVSVTGRIRLLEARLEGFGRNKHPSDPPSGDEAP
jgi:hypothetical protein